MKNTLKPVILFRKDYSTEAEFEIAKQYFDVYEYRNAIPENSLVIGRYSTLPYYKELEMDLELKNSKLINSHAQYNWIANFDWYHDLREFTFETWFEAIRLPEDTAFVVKGRTNSRKHEWNKLMFAEDKKRAIEIMIELGMDSLIGPQGVVFRKYEPLVTYEIGNNGLRFTEEHRVFCYKDVILCHAYYWTMAANIERPLSREGLKFAKEIVKVASQFANFYVIDIALKEDGNWVLVEVNEGSMAGLSENDPHILYANLFNCIWK